MKPFSYGGVGQRGEVLHVGEGDVPLLARRRAYDNGAISGTGEVHAVGAAHAVAAGAHRVLDGTAQHRYRVHRSRGVVEFNEAELEWRAVRVERGRLRGVEFGDN